MEKKPQGKVIVAGVDEVGRGPLAGPVFAAAVILNPKKAIEGLRDSKKLTVKQRDSLSHIIKEQSLAWAIAQASVEEIDDINILQASLLAMQRAVSLLTITPNHIKVDGNKSPKFSCFSEAIVGGDDLVPEISAASIIAKVARDAEMMAYHEKFPHYGFDTNKGYGTAFHLKALKKHGPTPWHRRSFAPVKIFFEKESTSIREEIL